MSTQKPISIPPKRLAQSITSSASAFKLNNILGWDGQPLTPADFGSVHHVVFMNETKTVIELIKIDPATISDDEITILARGLAFDGSDTEVGGNKLAWTANETIVMIGTHPPQLLNNFVDKGREQTITGLKTVPTPTADGHIATKKYVDDLAFGGSGTVDRLIVQGNAGESVAAGDFLYLNTADGEWYKTDASDSSKSFNVIIGVAQGVGTDGNNIAGGVLIKGLENNQSGLSVGDIMYLSDTPGEISDTAGTFTVSVGIARTTTSLYFYPNFNSLLTDDQKAALAGGGDFGTPSSTNKFVTEEFLETFNEPTVQVYTSNATWNKPVGLKYVVVEMVGGGGAGGADNGSNTAGAGGGGGGYCRKKISAADLGSTENVVVGLGGIGVNNSAGGNGTLSSFGSHCNASGGVGGLGNTSAGTGGVGGIGNNGDINSQGSSGDLPMVITASGGGIWSGRGGDSVLGGGASNKFNSLTGGGDSGNPGRNYGGGGSGYVRNSGGSTLPGGNGANGIVVVTEYYV